MIVLISTFSPRNPYAVLDVPCDNILMYCFNTCQAAVKIFRKWWNLSPPPTSLSLHPPTIPSLSLLPWPPPTPNPSFPSLTFSPFPTNPHASVSMPFHSTAPSPHNLSIPQSPPFPTTLFPRPLSPQKTNIQRSGMCSLHVENSSKNSNTIIISLRDKPTKWSSRALEWSF